MDVLIEGLRVLGQGLPLFLGIAAICALTAITVGAIVVSINWGVSASRTQIDPRVITATMTASQFAVIGAGLLVIALVLSCAAAATIQAAAEIASGQRLGLVESLGRVRAKGLQLFWLQWIVNVLAARFSPWAAPAMWVLVAPAIPLAVLEDRGPSEALDRMRALLRGSLLRMLALELVLLLAVLLTPFALGLAILPLGALEMSGLPPIASLAISIPAALILLIPVFYMFIVLTLAYRSLAEEPPLHARTATNVK